MRQAMLNENSNYISNQWWSRKGVINGAEALIRWHHKEWGLVSPGEFIPLAEENHMIHIITDWVIKSMCVVTALEAARACKRTISIKISPIRLMKRALFSLSKSNYR